MTDKLSRLIENIKVDDFILKEEFYSHILAGRCTFTFEDSMSVKQAIIRKCSVYSQYFSNRKNTAEQRMSKIYKEGFDRLMACEEDVRICELVTDETRIYWLFTGETSARVLHCLEMVKTG